MIFLNDKMISRLVVVSILSTVLFFSFLSSCSVNGIPTRNNDEKVLILSCSDDVKEVNPGEITEFKIGVINNLNITLNVTFQFTVEGRFNDVLDVYYYNWSGNFTENNVTLTSGEQTNTTFQIIAPVYAIAGTRKVVEIGAVGYDHNGTGHVAQTIDIFAIVNNTTKFSAFIDEPHQSCFQGESTTYSIMIENEGNGGDIIEFHMEHLPSGWTYNLMSPSIYLDPFEKVLIDLLITISLDAVPDADPFTPKMDPYLLKLNMKGLEFNQSEVLEIHLTVESNIDFRLSTQKVNKIAIPRSACEFIFSIENRGTSAEEVNVGIWRDLLEAEWKIYFSCLSLNERMDDVDVNESIDFTDILDTRELVSDTLYFPEEISTEMMNNLTLIMNAKEYLYIKIIVEIPEVAWGENVSFDVVENNEEDINPDDNILTFSVEIHMSDLYECGGFSYDEVKSEGIMIFNGSIGNKGDLSAKDVNVTLFIDNIAVSWTLIERVDVGDRIYFTLSWSFSPGKHVPKIVVDPLNEIPEMNEENNIAYQGYFTIPDEKKESKTPGFELFGTLVIIAFLLLLLYSHNKRVFEL